jgi:ribosomal protein S18 acetylase RimI-like enzyme
LWRRTHEPIELTERELRALVGSRDNIVLVGSIDETVVGYAIVRAHLLHDGDKLAEILELYVEPGAREVAVGEALVNAALAWADERACIGMDATALPGDRVAKNFFETNGFVARSLTMHRSITPSANGDR